MRNDDVFSIGSGKFLGITRTGTTEVSLKIKGLCGIKMAGNFNGNSVGWS